MEDLDPDLLNELSRGQLRYCVWQLEQGTETGHVHFQAYVEWKKPQRAAVFARWSALEPTYLDRSCFSSEHDEPEWGVERFSWCQGIHVSVRRASREAARQYCMVREFKGKSKGYLDGPWEWGEFTAGGQGTRNDLAACCAWIKGGGSIRDLAAKWPTTYVKYERGFRSLAHELSPVVFRDVEGWYIWGDTGVGKSHWVFSCYGPDNVYVVANESPLWFDGYHGQSVIFFEEFDSLVPIKKLLRIVDGYPLLVPVKNGFVRAEWSRVIITGNSDVSQQWPCELKRRFGFPRGLGTRGNVRHCKWSGTERVGFPTFEEAGGGGPFTIERRPHVVRYAPGSGPPPQLGMGGGSDLSSGSPGSSGDVLSSDAMAVGDGFDNILSSGDVGHLGVGVGLMSSVKTQILPSFAQCADGIVRYNGVCADELCVSCRTNQLCEAGEIL